MIQEIVRGNSKEANLSELMKGWIVGHMHDGLVGTTEFEIKLWHYDEPFDYGKKSFGGTEFIVIYGGVLLFKIAQNVNEKLRTKNITLQGNNHEYIIFPPDIVKTVIIEEAPAFGVTVRWPSGPDVNKVLQK